MTCKSSKLLSALRFTPLISPPTWQVALIGLVISTASCEAEPVISDSFDDAQTAWQLERDRTVHPIKQQRIRTDRDGESTGVEWIRYLCRPGYAARYWRPIGRAAVIDEQKIRLDMRCELPGATLAARVVLPFAVDPSTGQPTTALIRGDRYEQPGVWQTLTLSGTPGLAAGAARLLRARPGSPPIDDRGAYVDRVVLILPGAAKGVSVWLDNFYVDGVLLPPTKGTPTKGNPATGTLATGASAHGPALPNAASQPPASVPPVRVTASGFAIGRQKFYPRIWTYAGGALRSIHNARFNTVAFQQSPSDEQLAEVAQLGMRVICPPPSPDVLGKPTGQLGELDGKKWAPVLAWLVGQEDDSLDSVRAFAERVQLKDQVFNRPLIAAANSQWSQWSRLTDALVISRRGPDSPAADRLWRERVTDISVVSRPGTPLIHRIEAGLSEEASHQIRALVSSAADNLATDDQRLASEVWSAIANRSAGVWIDAGQRLSSADTGSRRLRQALTLINLQLQLIDPWLAGGERGAVLANSTGQPHAALMKRGRARLLIPAGGEQSLADQPKLVVPGASESSQAYQLSLASLAPLPVERVTGGMQIDAGAVSRDSMVVITTDRAALSAIANRVRKTAPPAVKLIQQLARDELATRTATAPTGRRTPGDPLRREAERQISIATAAAAAGDYAKAYEWSARTRQLFAEQRVTANANTPSLLRSPLAIRSRLAPADQRLHQLLAGSPRGANLLAGGNFENLNQTRQAGWVNVSLPTKGLRSNVELATRRPAHGGKCLRLAIERDPQTPASLAAGDCPVWITSPATRLAAGQLVEVTGWVRLESDSGENRVRLVLSDTLGGEQLGRVVDEAPSWRPFRLLRRAPRETDLQLTFGLSGEGAGYVDAVMIRPVQVGATPTPPARLSPVSPVANSPVANSPAANSPGDRQLK